MNTTIVARIPKSETAEVRVTRQSHKMRMCVDVRVWFIPKGSTEYVPSRKGVTVDAAKLPALLAALHQAL